MQLRQHARRAPVPGACLLLLLRQRGVPPLVVLVHSQGQRRLAHGRQHVHKGGLKQYGAQVGGAAVEQGARGQAARAVRLQGNQARPGVA